MIKTFSIKASEIKKNWILIDAQDVVLGRLASFVASRLRGKHKPEFTPHMDCGDYVVIVNADQIALTGKKWDGRIFHWHTGYPGGIKNRTMRQIRDGKNPERLVERAIERMLPGGPLSRQQMRHLFVYCGETHTHAAQKPEILDFGAMNTKNKRA